MSAHLGLSDNVLTQSVRAPINANGTAANSSALDMSGYDAVRFVINVGVLGTNGTVDAQVISSANSNLSGATAITNSALTQVVNANTMQIIEVWRPNNRYVALQTTGHTNGAQISAICDLYHRNGVLPPTQVAAQVVKVAQN